MLNVTFTADPGVRRLTAFRFVEAATWWADAVEAVVEAELKGHAPVGKGPDAGDLRDSIGHRRHTTPSAVTVEFTAKVPYAKFVIGGTRAHPIAPRRAKALYWVDPGGGARFARLVHHPGTKPNQFARRAVQPLVPMLSRRLAAAVSAALRR